MDLARSATGSHPRTSILVCGAAAAVFLAGVVLAPVLERTGASGGAALRMLYRPLCHQMPSRSLSIAGRPLAVCARCLGLYTAGTVAILLAALLFPRMLRVRPLWFAAAWLPTVIDVLARFAGFAGLSNELRLLIGLPAGFLAGLLLSEGVADLAILLPRGFRLGCSSEDLPPEPRSAPRGV